jgi:hypothetical protein
MMEGEGGDKPCIKILVLTKWEYNTKMHRGKVDREKGRWIELAQEFSSVELLGSDTTL